ncbi:MAG: hypothetical protein Q7U44_10025, partial [Desulfuromonadales bacterium]|nr:hypothetical protein [Desulfuromonadales bacterium]
LTITLINPNSTVATLIAPLTDYFPSGLVVAGTGPNASTTCGGTLTAITGATKIILTGGSIPANSSCRVKVDVTAKNKGSYYNKLPAGALQTNKGSNATSASATLTVLAAKIAPKLGKAFSPSTIKAGGVSTLSITLSNPNSTVAKLTASLTDYFPSGLVVAGTGANVRNTCGGTVKASKGSSKVTLTGGSIPLNGSCTVKVNVTAKHKSTYYNKLLVGALKTDMGSNTKSASAILKVK